MSRPLDQITRPELRELIYEKLKSGLAPKTGINPLTRDEARAFLEAVEEHNPRYFPFSLCALRTGMRLGELLALEGETLTSWVGSSKYDGHSPTVISRLPKTEKAGGLI